MKPLTLREAVEAIAAAIIFAETRARWGAEPPREAFDRAVHDARTLLAALQDNDNKEDERGEG